ncbi:MAG: hypothetical protein K2Y51_23675 [Gammaproteobacteria bacterium]|jgi:hypothetical protein|nr:hypothetical protein [Gammaproteobacteria bacterium]
MTDQDPDGVGYKRPPRHTRFAPGRSGNPKGRPKGTKNLKTDLKEELSQQIVIREGDRQKSISKQRAILKSMVGRSIKGEQAAAKAILSLIQQYFDDGEQPPDILDADEQAVLAALKTRLARDDAAGPPPVSEEAPDEE